MLLQGSAYKLELHLTDADGLVVTDARVEKGSFTFGDITKLYNKDGTGEVKFDSEINAWIIPLSESETFKLNEYVEWQARLLFDDGLIDGTQTRYENVGQSIDKTVLSGGSNNA